MPKVSIDLGRDLEDSMPSEVSIDKTLYPTLHVDTTKKVDFPHEGTMTVRFKKISSSMSEGDDRKPRYSCTLEIHKIEELYPEDDSEREPKTGDVLDEIADTVMKARKAGKSSY